MNILFFLTPKSEVAYIFEDETLRQTVEKMEHRKFSCIPLLSKDGRYTGTISEGDLLWGIKRMHLTDIKDMEDVSIMAIPRRATYKPVHADADMEDLLDRAINQNYVPVIDDQGYFIGIITRKEIIKYCYKEMKELSYLREKAAQAQEAENDSSENQLLRTPHNTKEPVSRNSTDIPGTGSFLTGFCKFPLQQRPFISPGSPALHPGESGIHNLTLFSFQILLLLL